MLKEFRDWKESFKLLIKSAINSWDDQDLKYLAESLVHFFLSDPDCESPSDSLLERLSDIIEIELEYINDFDNPDYIVDDSFWSMIFKEIVKLPETRHYLQ